MNIKNSEKISDQVIEEQKNAHALQEVSDTKVFIIRLLIRILNEADLVCDEINENYGEIKEYIEIPCHKEEIIVSTNCDCRKNLNLNYLNQTNKLRKRYVIFKSICDSFGIIFNFREDRVFVPETKKEVIVFTLDYKIPSHLIQSDEYLNLAGMTNKFDALILENSNH